MEEEKKNQHKPILTILSAISLILFWVALVLCFLTDSTVYGVLLLTVPFLGVLALVLTIVSRRERFKKTWTALLIVDILSLVIGFISLPLLSLRGINLGMSDQVKESAMERAKIENVLPEVPKTGMTIRNRITTDSPYRFFDGDGSIARQFTSLDFTLISETDTVGASPYWFGFDKETTVTFDPSFDRLCVSAGVGDLFGHHYVAYRTYGFNAFEGRKLKDMIDGRVKEQLDAYEKSRQEALEGFTFDVALEGMKESETKFLCLYFNDTYELGFKRVYDEERTILQAFSDINPAQMTYLEEPSDLSHYTFYYHPSGNKCPYSLHYYDTEKVLSVSKAYKDPYDGNRSVYIYYRVGVEEGENLLKKVVDIVTEKPIAY